MVDDRLPAAPVKQPQLQVAAGFDPVDNSANRRVAILRPRQAVQRVDQPKALRGPKLGDARFDELDVRIGSGQARDRGGFLHGRWIRR